MISSIELSLGVDVLLNMYLKWRTQISFDSVKHLVSNTLGDASKQYLSFGFISYFSSAYFVFVPKICVWLFVSSNVSSKISVVVLRRLCTRTFRDRDELKSNTNLTYFLKVGYDYYNSDFTTCKNMALSRINDARVVKVQCEYSWALRGSEIFM